MVMIDGGKVPTFVPAGGDQRPPFGDLTGVLKSTSNEAAARMRNDQHGIWRRSRSAGISGPPPSAVDTQLVEVSPAQSQRDRMCPVVGAEFAEQPTCVRLDGVL